jgi:sulfur transfer complex TusBCD TusB component (DsrH family)
MSKKDTSLQSSPQLVLEQQGVVVALSMKQVLSLFKKSEQSGIPFDTLKEVYQRGYTQSLSEQIAYNRVNSFIAGGAAMEIDQDLLEKRGLWDNIHAKQERIKNGSGEHMRKPGSKGAPTKTALKISQNEDADPCWKDYRQIGMKMKGGRSVPNCVPKEETQNEGQANWSRARKENERSSVANLNQPKKSYVDRKYTPMKSDEKERVTAATKDFVSKGGTIQKIAPGKKTIKSFVRPKKYMTPNQASRVTEDINYAFEAYIGSEPASKDKNDPKNRFVGTDTIVKNYADATPDQGAAYANIKSSVIKEN